MYFTIYNSAIYNKTTMMLPIYNRQEGKRDTLWITQKNRSVSMRNGKAKLK